MDLVLFHRRYLQVTMWIYKNHDTDESSTEQASDMDVFSARGTRFLLGRTCWGSRDTNEELEESQEM